MELIERKIENYAVVFNVNLLRATLIEATEFRDILEETVLETDKDIIVNLSACEHLDSTFLGVLVSCYKRLKSQNRTLVLIEPVDQSSIFLTLNSIGKIFPLYTNVKVALEDIENKKLLEKEIIELGNEKGKPDEKLSNAPSKITSFPIPNSSPSLTKEEINPNELDPDPQVLEEETIYDNSFSINNSSEEQKFVLTEVEEAQQNMKVNFLKMPNESTQEKEVSEFIPEENVKEEIIQIQQQVVVQRRNFNGNKVEWEFGFS